MDITLDYASFPLLLWAPFLLLLCSCQDASGVDRTCPQGQLVHSMGGFVNTVVCCKPVWCGKGEQVAPCGRNGTQDTCQQCAANTNISRRTSSFKKEGCTFWPLDGECRKAGTNSWDLSDTRTQFCMCDIEKGVMFIKPEMIMDAHKEAFCQRMRGKCDAGQEPILNGTCKPCEDGYFNSKKSYKLCKPKTKCEMLGLQYTFISDNGMKDNTCSKPVPVTTPKPKVTEPVVVPVVNPKPEPPDPRPAVTTSTTVLTTPPALSSTAAGMGGGAHGDGAPPYGSSLGTDADTGGGDGSSDLVGPILGTVLFLLVVIIVIGVILFCRKRRGLGFWCGSVKTFSDPEKNIRRDASLMAEPHQRNKIILGGGGSSSSSSNNILSSTGNTTMMPLTSGDKVMNNNTTSNGRLPSHHYNNTGLQRGGGGEGGSDLRGGQQQPGNGHHGLYTNEQQYGGESVEGHHYNRHPQDEQMFPPANMFPPSPGQNHLPHANSSAASPRQGILRNGGPKWHGGAAASGGGGHGQSALDSIAREKLQVQMLAGAREANVDAGGEGDPLLVSESPQAFPHHHHQAPRDTGGRNVVGGFNHPHSHHHNNVGAPVVAPPLVQGGMNPRCYLPNQQPPPAMSSSGSTAGVGASGSEVTFAPQEVTFAPQPAKYVQVNGPPGVVATFMRSSSVIATPEGEVDEDDMEAIVPRFSQLLPADGEDAGAAPPDGEGGEGGNSPDREINTGGRGDTRETTTQQLRSPNQRLFMPRQSHNNYQNPPAVANTQGGGGRFHPSLLVQRSTTGAPNPPPPPGGNSQSDHHIMNLKEQQLEQSLPSSPTQQREQAQHSSHSPSSSLTSQLKFPSDVSETEALKTANDSGERHQPSTQETDLKTRLSPIEDSDLLSGPGATSLVGRKLPKMTTGEKEEDTAFSPVEEREDGEETEQKTHQLVGGLEGERMNHNHQNSLERKGRGDTVVPPASRMAARDRRRMASGGSTTSNNSNNSTLERRRGNSENVAADPSTARKMSYTRMVSFEGEADDSERDQTEQKRVSREGLSSSGASTHSSESSPNRANKYHRSQSENISHGSESPHRPPPRSNSEEKPQSSSKPVAKVRPMPATSDSQLPVEVSDGVSPVATPGNILSYSSDESDGEETGPRHLNSSVDTAETEGNQEEERGHGET